MCLQAEVDEAAEAAAKQRKEKIVDAIVQEKEQFTQEEQAFKAEVHSTYFMFSWPNPLMLDATGERQA